LIKQSKEKLIRIPQLLLNRRKFIKPFLKTETIVSSKTQQVLQQQQHKKIFKNSCITFVSLVCSIVLSNLVVEKGLDQADGGTTGRVGQLLHRANRIVVVDRSFAVIFYSGL
jgi:hypothetical protein